MTTRWIDFDYAVIRLVPSVHRGAGFNVGVVLHAPTERTIRARFLDDLSPFEAFAPELDWERVASYLAALVTVAEGTGGPLCDLTASERFHWLTAPRSDILQPGATHAGRARDLDDCIDHLFDATVTPPSR